ncbi:MAG: phytoene/squalene synthase family protein [Bacteroidetes bacterium]|nr:phytoene/squalene synthase family protein [Bacteroidota bacterium]
MHEYHNVSFDISKVLTNAYSTSFSLGIKAFVSEYRNAIYAVYGYVRVADEIVDSFHGFDKKKLLDKFRNDTHEAIETGISTNPVIHSFQKVVNEYAIDIKLIDAFLKSMESDLYENYYEREEYDHYIYGSAEVVGLMCLKVFVNGNDDEYEKLKYSAQMLGAAFQKVNFLRDIKSDIDERKRIYLPGVDREELITDKNKKNLEKEIEREFSEALKGIMLLPVGVKLGVYSAFQYYYGLFRKIQSLSVKDLLSRRVRISNIKKLFLLLKSFIEIKFLKTA